ncbi:hypothetical protein CENSYa_1286 [Cenarchaeum symbiosum A]|uniref:Uncharacterized protein n=1 Tax=Cenarchaeum symbiosum (strain A) TaxID=414004 RepID=A0RX42_CENSY|nr:hypothetical protein CENSYa_1286 [Cenarchaeum symbiosum A]
MQDQDYHIVYSNWLGLRASLPTNPLIKISFCGKLTLGQYKINRADPCLYSTPVSRSLPKRTQMGISKSPPAVQPCTAGLCHFGVGLYPLHGRLLCRHRPGLPDILSPRPLSARPYVWGNGPLPDRHALLFLCRAPRDYKHKWPGVRPRRDIEQERS